MVKRQSTVAQERSIARLIKGTRSERGASVAEAAAKYGVTERTVRSACAANNVSTKRPTGSGRTLRILVEIIRSIDGRTMTRSFREIGESLGGVPRQRIHQVFAEAVQLKLVNSRLTLKKN